MAKKPAKSLSKRSPSKAAAQPAKKPHAKASKKAATKKALATVSTGSGATPAELGAKLVELFNQNKADPWVQTVWSKDVISIEGSGQIANGKKEILDKWEWWVNNHEMLGASAEGPYVGATGFAVRFNIHVKDKATGNEVRMAEVAVYTVKNGKITREEFMYGN